jgi:hypothetical protein
MKGNLTSAPADNFPVKPDAFQSSKDGAADAPMQWRLLTILCCPLD